MHRTERRQPGVAALVTALLLAGLVTVFTLRTHQFGLSEQAVLILVALVTVVLPGWVLTWWARSRHILGQFGLAFAAGVPIQVLGWWLSVSTGWRGWCWVVPLGVAAIAAALLRWRSAVVWRVPREALAMPWWAALSLVATWSYVMALFATLLTNNSLRDPRGWYQDLYWHASINAEALTRVPNIDPQATTEGLNYHWISNAHVAALSLAGDLDVRAVGFVFMVAALAAAMGLTYGFAFAVGRSHLGAAIALPLTVFASQFAVDQAVIPLAGAPGALQLLSPSHILALAMLTALVWMLVELLRGNVGWPMAPSGIGLVIIASGVKISIVPSIGAGLLLAAIVSAVQWRTRRRQAIVATSIGVFLLVTLLLEWTTFGGGGAGSSFAIGGRALDAPLVTNTIDAFGSVSTVALAIFVLLVICTVLPYAFGFVAMRFGSPVSWFLLGTIGASFAVVMLLRHAGGSQVYFAREILPVAAAVSGVGIAILVRRGARQWGARKLSLALVAALIAGGILGVVALSWPRWEMLTLRTALLAGAVTLGAMVLASLVIWLRRSWGFAAVTAVGVFAVALVPSMLAMQPQQSYLALFENPQGMVVERDSTITPAELEAANALRTETPADARVATNVHCYVPPTAPNCNARGFWVAGLGERMTLVGGWGYAASARELEGVGGLPGEENPYADSEVYELNEAVFSDPTRERIEEIKSTYRVTHLVADSRHGEVSPELINFCDPVFENAEVLVCELRG